MKRSEFIKRQLVIKRLLNVFSGMDGGGDFMALRGLVDSGEGETITRVLTHMGALLDVAEAALDVTFDDLPEWAQQKADTLTE
ncbi:hypothetical protein CPT_Slocum_102 [Serratia phage Slocum]|nr:hypothetical protein CPT_Slocum_102 [Serratia phage Slocum]